MLEWLQVIQVDFPTPLSQNTMIMWRSDDTPRLAFRTLKHKPGKNFQVPRPSAIFSFTWEWVWFAWKSTCRRTYFHMNGFTRRLVLTQRHEVTRKRPKVNSAFIAMKISISSILNYHQNSNRKEIFLIFRPFQSYISSWHDKTF